MITQQEAEIRTGLQGREVPRIDREKSSMGPSQADRFNAVGDPHRCQLGKWHLEKGSVTIKDNDGKYYTAFWQDHIFHLVGYGPTFADACEMALGK